MNLTFQKILALVVVGFLYACNSSSGSDCFQAAGDSVSMVVEVDLFSKVRSEGEVTLFIRQGDVQEVALTTGENLLSDVSISVIDGTLVVSDTNACNFVRDYGLTIVTITTPNLTDIRNASNYDITSIGTLRFPKLTLSSNTEAGPENPKKTGDFYLDIICDEFNLSANGQSVFYVSGSAEIAEIKFTDENPRFEGRDFLVNEIDFFQRSSNKIIINPQEKLTGTIASTGDVISVNRPPIVAVEILFTGQLIFE
ncbi:MAG: hypothetical protein ACI849_000571 [Patiriisocius sp.]|jgi:hypothetical protein